jgi:hypothetical protein
MYRIDVNDVPNRKAHPVGNYVVLSTARVM